MIWLVLVLYLMGMVPMALALWPWEEPRVAIVMVAFWPVVVILGGLVAAYDLLGFRGE